MPDPSKNPFDRFQIEIDAEAIENTLRGLRKRLSESFQAGRHTKVRLSFQGKPILPDIPLAVFLAGEGIAFWVVSPLAAVLVNLGGKAILDVEFIHEADELVQEGLEAYLAGDVDVAEAKYREALARRADDPSALYNLGTLLRVTGKHDEALRTLRKAAMGPAGHPDVARASEAVEKLTAPKRTL